MESVGDCCATKRQILNAYIQGSHSSPYMDVWIDPLLPPRNWNHSLYLRTPHICTPNSHHPNGWQTALSSLIHLRPSPPHLHLEMHPPPLHPKSTLRQQA